MNRALLIGGTLFFIQSFAILAADATQHENQSSENPRARLTEREDENRVKQPTTIQFLGHPLSASLQYELGFDWIRQFKYGNLSQDLSSVILEQQIEPEVFYNLGPRLSFFAQARAGLEKDLISTTRNRVSQSFVERGELWLHSKPIPSFPLTFEMGRLDFEDDRRWWWDEDLDALRITIEKEPVELSIAIAQEMGPIRSDRNFIEPEKEAVQRLIVEAAWDLSAHHSIQIFALNHRDRSRIHSVGEQIRSERKDDSDAKLTWLGARAVGARAFESGSLLGYWLNVAQVRGNEYIFDFEQESITHSVVNERIQRDIFGWALDVGTTWISSSFDVDPRFTLGYALGSGDSNPNDSRDRAFRQTGLHANSPGFGGVQSFEGYGVFLDPELSNLAIVTAGAGLSLYAASSLDLIYHYYQQVEPTDSLRNARLNTPLTGRNRDLGHGLDLVLAVEEWNRFQFEITASAFRAGAAFGIQDGQWTFGGLAKLRFAF